MAKTPLKRMRITSNKRSIMLANVDLAVRGRALNQFYW